MFMVKLRLIRGNLSRTIDYATIIAPPLLTGFDRQMASLLGENDELLTCMNSFCQVWTVEKFLDKKKNEAINLLDFDDQKSSVIQDDNS